jgi:hypothetical protein
MSGARETLERVIGALENAGARYMVVGSFASTLHGQPRTTQDIDLVIDASPAELDRFLESLPGSEWYFDSDAAREALRRRSMFNLVDLRTGWKADLICIRDSAFAVEEFSRRMPAELLGLRVRVATAEDTVLAKLAWARESGSDRQLEDAAGIVAAAGDEFDRAYVTRWATELGVEDLWLTVSRP